MQLKSAAPREVSSDRFNRRLALQRGRLGETHFCLPIELANVTTIAVGYGDTPCGGSKYSFIVEDLAKMEIGKTKVIEKQ